MWKEKLFSDNKQQKGIHDLNFSVQRIVNKKFIKKLKTNRRKLNKKKFRINKSY